MKRHLMILVSAFILFTIVVPVKAQVDYSKMSLNNDVIEKEWRNTLTVNQGYTHIDRSYDCQPPVVTTKYEWTSITAVDSTKDPELTMILQKKHFLTGWKDEAKKIETIPVRTKMTTIRWGKYGNGTIRFQYETGTKNYPTGAFSADPYIVQCTQ